MEQVDWIRRFVEPLHTAGIDYVVTGSVACVLRGEPRLTMDVDIVLDIGEAAADVIEMDSGMKADFYTVGSDPLHRWAIEHGEACVLGDITVMVAPSEDVIVRKLEFHREGGSAKHLRDIASLLAIDVDIDCMWIEKEVAIRGLSNGWEAAQSEG